MVFQRSTWLYNGAIKKLWPLYRGKRAGRLVKVRETLRRYEIKLIQPREMKRAFPVQSHLRSHNTANCIHITPTTTITQKKGSATAYVPSVLLSNVMSLAPKIDELRHVVSYSGLSCVCITETWLQSHINDNTVALEGFNLVRRDRRETIHGGVCMFIRDTIKFTVLDDLDDSSFEVLWVKLRPMRLPRGFSCIVVGVVYHPPNANNFAMLDYLAKSLSSIESRFSNCGFMIVGDFNGLNTTRLQRSFGLKQLVNFPTRGRNTLDLMLTNMKDHYEVPSQRPPFGLSDHMSVEIKPKSRDQLPKTNFKIKSRDLRPSSRLAMRTYLQAVDVPTIVDAMESCEEKLSCLEKIITTGLDLVLPIRSKNVCTTEPPWITSTLKQLIKERQRALSCDNLRDFKQLRNRVNRERKICRAKYYQAKVAHLKESKPAVWWREVKKLSGLAPAFVSRNNISKPLQQLYGTSDETSLANIINEAFISPMRNFIPLPADYINDFTNSVQSDQAFVVSGDSVLKKLSKLNPTKAQGPDGIPGWLLKENADLLFGTVTDILNCSYREGHLPLSWKEANIIPIPKKTPIQDVNKHLRPISLTPILSKVAEEFVVDTYVKPAVMEKLDVQQFGTVPRSCTTHALISMMHSLAKSTDGNGATTRVILFDFRKAFDLIDHGVLAQKLSNYNIPKSVMCWILDFLMSRKQRVKLSNDCYSEWGSVPAGVPQGTKLGPWLFLIMINDLKVDNADLWKYVDDTTLAESVKKEELSSMQMYADELITKTEADGFQLNETKCKELRVSFSKSNNVFEPIVINEKNVEVVPAAKLLGLTISNDLKWNTHIAEICKKVASRLYFLRQLKRAKLPTKDLILFYITCIRPITEYACEVFHGSLPQYLSDDLENLQKRALRIIHPELSYSQALQTVNLGTLSSRRQSLNDKLFQEIIDDNSHKLHKLLPPRNNSTVCLRNKRMFQLPKCKTNRLKNSFIPYNSYRHSY